MLSRAIKAAAGDALITFLWVFCVSTVGALTAVIQTSYLQIHGVPASLLITTTLIFFFVFVFSILSYFIGGASFNPTGTAAFFAAGLGNDNLITMALRFPAQVSLSLFVSLVSSRLTIRFLFTLCGVANV